MSPEDKQLLDETFAAHARYLDRHHSPGFGIFPSADPASNYFNQVWVCDSAHAAAHYFARAKPEAVIDSLRTILRNQRADGALPSRVEREYQTLKLTPGLRWLAKPLFRLVEGRWRGRTERPVHEGKDSAGGEDTVPAVLIAAGELFDGGSSAGRAFIQENFPSIARAAEFFRRTKTDPADGLAVMTRDNADWADTIKRKGKLGLVNIWWWRGVHHLEDIAKGVGEQEKAEFYHRESETVKKSIIEKLYDKDGAFFRAEAAAAGTQEGDRLDTAASIFGALYFLTPDESWRVERTLKHRVEHSSGLQNFDPPYPQKDIFWAHRLMGQWLYHNKFVWPWVTLQNIFVKIKIAREHGNVVIRGQYQHEAVEDLVKIAKLFKTTGGAYEVFEPDEPRRGETKFYHPPQNFMGSMAAYQGVYTQLKKLSWI